MTGSTMKAALIAFALLCGATLAYGDEKQPPPAAAADATGAKKTAKVVKLVQPVDINGASKAQLKTIPGVTDEEAEKIIAGRPYLTKAHLVTHNIISMTRYLQIKDRIVARQKK